MFVVVHIPSDGVTYSTMWGPSIVEIGLRAGGCGDQFLPSIYFRELHKRTAPLDAVHESLFRQVKVLFRCVCTGRCIYIRTAR